MIEMSENYVDLISLFPDNAKKGFKTEALPSIWENKDEFNQLMKKSSDDMIKLAANIETAADVKQSLGNMMWANYPPKKPVIVSLELLINFLKKLKKVEFICFISSKNKNNQIALKINLYMFKI